MPPELDRLLVQCGGVATREAALGVMSRHAFDNEVKSGRLAALFPRTYGRPWAGDDPDALHRAALLTVGGDVALSHTSTLRCWDLPVPDALPIHVKAYQPRHPRGVAGKLVVHRTLLPLQAQLVNGFPAVSIESALVDSWPLLSGSQQRAPIIEACRRRLVSTRRLASATESMFWVRGIREARKLVALVLAGCESELELYGYSHVFAVPQLQDAHRQLWVQVGSRRYRLDMAFEEEMLDVELDGRQYHSGDQREKDIARDRAVATIGWQTLRYSHAQLHLDPVGCCREVIAVRAARRRMLRIA